MKQNILYKTLNLLSILLLFIGIYHINILAPLVPGDDYLYQNIFPDNGIYGNQKPHSLTDFIESSINHYINYNYRVLPHFLLQVLLTFPQWVFDLINTIVFFILPFIVLRPVADKFKDNYIDIYTITLLLIWLLHPDLSWSYFWTTGSVSYSWFLILQLFLLSSFYLKWERGKDISSLDILVAVFCCSSNEAIVLSLFIAGGVLAWRDYSVKAVFDKKLFIILIVLLAGGVFMLLSPSFTTRIHNTYSGLKESSFFSVEKLMRQAYFFFRIGLFALLYFCLKQKTYQFNSSRFLLIVLLVFSAIMFWVPIYETRSSVFPFFVGVMFFISAVKDYREVRSWSIVVVLIISVIFYLNLIEHYKHIEKPFERNLKKLNASSDKSEIVYLETFCPLAMNSNIMCDDIYADSLHFHNQSLSSTFGVHSVIPLGAYSIYERNLKLEKAILENRLELLSNTKVGCYHFLNENCLENIFYTKGEDVNQTNIVVRVSAKPDLLYTLILRGANHSFYHRLLDLLPLKIRINFLDFLERDRKGIIIGENHYYNNPVYNIDKYRYFVLSYYSYNAHNIVGEPFIFESEN